MGTWSERVQGRTGVRLQENLQKPPDCVWRDLMAPQRGREGAWSLSAITDLCRKALEDRDHSGSSPGQAELQA